METVRELCEQLTVMMEAQSKEWHERFDSGYDREADLEMRTRHESAKAPIYKELNDYRNSH